MEVFYMYPFTIKDRWINGFGPGFYQMKLTKEISTGLRRKMRDLKGLSRTIRISKSFYKYDPDFNNLGGTKGCWESWIPSPDKMTTGVFMKKFIGVKMVDAKPMTLGEYNLYRGWVIPQDEDSSTKGYYIQSPSGHESWTPADLFESEFLELTGDGTKITEETVLDFIGEPESITSAGDGKTTIVGFNCKSGFTQFETSACVDPENYNESLGIKYATEDMKKKTWKLLGFVLQWAREGLN